jgi:hypothetical protein
MEEQIKLFLSSGDGYGSGDGSGSGYGYGFVYLNVYGEKLYNLNVFLTLSF